jgi:acetyl esterase
VNARDLDPPWHPPGLAPESRLILERLAAAGLLAEGDGEFSVEGLRSQFELELPLFGPAPVVAAVDDVEIGGEGTDEPVRVRIYRPSDQPAPRAILWLHGGGWALGTLNLADAQCRRLCLATESLVASVEYRLAPEHRFPAGLDDAATALRWLDGELSAGDGEKPRLIVGGESAGGNLAAALALRTRDAGGPRIEHQILIYPVTDSACDTPSHREFAAGYLLEREEMKLFWELYVDRPEQAGDPLASILRAPDLEGLPPATVVLAGCDLLRDEGYAYAARLAAAAVPVKVLLYPGQIHGFWSYGGVSSIGDSVNRDISVSLRCPPG